VTIVAMLVLVACSAIGGGGDGQVTPDPDTGVKGGDADGILQIAQGVGDGPGISIDDAIGQAGTGPLLINGSLFIDRDGSGLLCSAIAESFPPQCGGTRLRVRDLDLSSVPNLEEANGVRWAEAIQLLGTVALVEN